MANVDKSFAFDMMTDFCQITTWVGQYLQLCWTRRTWPLRKSYLLTIYSLCETYKIIIICTYHLDLTQHHSLTCSQNVSICGLLLICQDINKRVHKINVTNFHVFKCLVQSCDVQLKFDVWLIYFNLCLCLCDNIIGILETHCYAMWPVDALHLHHQHQVL